MEMDILDHLVIYHGNCSDGFVAGLIAYRSMQYFTSFKVLPVNVSRLEEEIDNLPLAKSVVSFDVSFKKSSFEKFLRKYPGAQVYDHHISSFQEIGVHPNFHFDNTISGAMLAWNYFYPFFPTKVPAIVEYVQDRDLWRYALPHSREVTTWLYDQLGKTFPLTTTGDTNAFFAWLPYLSNDSWVDDAIEKGSIMHKQLQSEIQWIVRTAGVFAGETFGVEKVAVVNTCIHISEVGEALCQDPQVDCAIMWYVDHNKKAVKVSLRSASNGADVSKIAAKFGGGGHAHAAGFEAKEDFVQILLKLVRQNRL